LDNKGDNSPEEEAALEPTWNKTKTERVGVYAVEG